MRGLGKATAGALIVAIAFVFVIRSIGVNASAPVVRVAVNGTEIADDRAIVHAAAKPCRRSLPWLERLLGYRKDHDVQIIRTEPSGSALTVIVDCRTGTIRSPSA